jgi:hypothetical protein
MRVFLLDKYRIEEGSEKWKSGLKYCHQHKIHPLCLCKENGIPMYVAKVNNDYIIKRMPNSGIQHASICESFDIPSELSGRGQVNEQAISEDPESGIVTLKIDFSLSKVNITREPIAGESKDKDTVQSDPKKISLKSLLHYLYEDAGLNKWSPKMAGKRNWHVVRKYLANAAKNKVAKKNNLSERLFIPETFNMDDKERLAFQARQFLKNLTPVKHKKPIGIIIGEVKDIETARYGYKLLIKHLASTPLFFGEEVFKQASKHFSQELDLFQKDETTHLLAIASFFVSDSGNPQVDNLSFMIVDKHWLPFESLDERQLIDNLIEKKRHFIKCLRYNLGKEAMMASTVITEKDSDSSAIFIVPNGVGEDYYQKINETIKENQINGKIWDLNDENAFEFLKTL